MMLIHRRKQDYFLWRSCKSEVAPPASPLYACTALSALPRDKVSTAEYADALKERNFILSLLTCSVKLSFCAKIFLQKRKCTNPFPFNFSAFVVLRVHKASDEFWPFGFQLYCCIIFQVQQQSDTPQRVQAFEEDTVYCQLRSLMIVISQGICTLLQFVL